MVDDELREPFRDQLIFFLLQIASTLITALFLAIWVAVQYSINYLVGLLPPSGVDQMVLWAFQGIFAITTLIPILIYYYVDLRVSIIRARKKITEEFEK